VLLVAGGGGPGPSTNPAPGESDQSYGLRVWAASKARGMDTGRQVDRATVKIGIMLDVNRAKYAVEREYMRSWYGAGPGGGPGVRLLKRNRNATAVGVHQRPTQEPTAHQGLTTEHRELGGAPELRRFQHIAHIFEPFLCG